MKNLIATAAVFVLGLAAHGQGEFLFDTHDISSGNDLRFVNGCIPVSGDNLFVQVFAGPDAAHLTPTGAPLALDRAGVGVGYTDPFGAIFIVSGLAGGQSARIACELYQGTSFANATSRSELIVLGTVTLTEPPNVPNEVYVCVGSGNVGPLNGVSGPITVSADSKTRSY